MTASSSLSAYRIEIRPKFSRGKPWTFKLGAKEDPFSAIEAYCTNRTQGYTLFGGSSLLIIKDLVVDKPARMIDGLVYRGTSGNKQDLVDIKTGVTTYRKKRNEAALEPCYFSLRLDDARAYGVAILQNQGVNGIKGLLQDDMASYFDRATAPLTVHFAQIVDSKAVERFASLGVLKDVVLINNGQTTTSRTALSRNSVGGDSLNHGGDKLELHLKKRGGWRKTVWDKLITAIRKGDDPAQLINAPSMGAIDEVRVVVKVGKMSQSFNILRSTDAPIRYDIADNVDFGSDGYPTLASLRRVSAKTYKDSILPLL